MAISSKTATIPSYRRHKASGQAVVTLNGVDHYLGPWNTAESRTEYDRVLNERLSRGRQLGEKTKDADPGPLLMNELIAGYHSYVFADTPQLVVNVRMALRPDVPRLTPLVRVGFGRLQRSAETLPCPRSLGRAGR